MNGGERSTVSREIRFDLSPDADHASTALRSEPCQCGGRIIVLEGERPSDVVAQHNGSFLHAFWRWRKGL